MLSRIVVLATLLCGVTQGQPPRALLPKAAVAPAYPFVAAGARISGTVVVRLTVNESGRAVSEKVATGHPLLRSAAVEAARRWKFGKASAERRTVDVTFRFELSPEQDEANSVTTFFPPDEVEVRYTPARPPVNYGAR